MATKRKRHKAICDAYPYPNAEAQAVPKYKTRITVHAAGFRVEHVFSVSVKEIFDAFWTEVRKGMDLLVIGEVCRSNSSALIIPASVYKNAVIEIEPLPEDHDTSEDWI